MRLKEVYRFELEYRLRSPSTWLYAGLLFLVAIWMFLATSDGAEVFNAPERIAVGSAIVGTVGMIVTAALFGGAAIRDVAAEMDPLLFTSPLRKVEYLGGRFLAALTLNAILAVAIVAGFLFVSVLLGRLEPEEVGPFRIAAYLQAYVLFVLPNLILSGSILYAIGALTRHVVPVYLGAIALFISYLVALNTVGQVASPVLSALSDPLGIRTLEETTGYWTAAERNAQLIGFPATLVLNRLVWLAVAGVVFAVLHRVFRFAHPDGGRGRKEHGSAHILAEPKRLAPVAVPRVSGSFGFRTTIRQTLAVARNFLAEVTASRSLIVVILACTGLTLLLGWNVGDTVFETSTWPVTFLVHEEVLSGRVGVLPYLLIALYAGELVWKDRDVGVAEIADAAPVPEGAALLGRFLALVVMLVMFQTALLVGGILIQALHGYYNFQLGLYLRAVFGLDLAGFVILAALAMTIHVVVNHKSLGHIVVLIAFAHPFLVRPLGLIEHHLLLFGTDPGWTYSDMNGFGPFVEPWVWFNLYWAAWAALLIVIAIAFWVRGREPGTRHRLLVARTRFSQMRALARAASVAIALILVLGGFVFYNTNVLNEYRSAKERGAPQAEYEKRYGRYESAPQPVITAADLRVELYPEKPAVDIRGTYSLVNRTDAAIDSVHVYLRPDVLARSISLDRPTEPALVDEEIGYRIFALEQALEPGDSVQLAFDVAFRPRGFTNSGIQTDIVSNGTYFNRKWLPFIGYQAAFELPDAESRERFGLEPRPTTPGPGETVSRMYRESVKDEDLVQVSAILGTSADQVAITPGVLRRSWTDNGRRYFHYETERPASFGATVFSGRFAVVEDRWKDVPLRIYHHPAHNYNLDRMVRGMKAALEYLTAEFGPYPYSHLRIVEIPRYDSFGRAHPNTIAFTEDNFIRRVDRDDLDHPFFGTAHEVAHTWWGGQVRSASGVKGQGFLSESLANYSAMMVTETTYGLEAARRVYDFQMDRYLRQRAERASDVPLLESEDQPWIFYGKGAVAMYLLRDHIGAERVNTALRRYLEKNLAGAPPYPTSLDLYAELRAVTPDSLHYLLTDLFETVTLWEVKTERAVVEPTGNGEYEVALEVVAKKERADSVGNMTEVPMNDEVEIGVFAPGVDEGLGEPLYLKRHRIRSGEQTIRITVRREPARAGIDPYRKLIDRQGHDNVAEVEAAATDPVGTGP